MPRRCALVVLLVLLSRAFVGVTVAQEATPPASPTAADGSSMAIDPFYEPPSPLPPGRPGALLRAAPVPAPPGVRAWRILYRSTALDGAGVAVSGAVFAPDRPAPPDGFPLVTVGHGTTGLARGCAPSLDPFRPLPGSTESVYRQQVEGFVDAGFGAVVADYQGLGAAGGVHPYLVGDVEGHNVLDAARAARALPGLRLAPATLIWGHSQGGHAAAWAGQLAATYAPELRIVGVILGAPAAELELVPPAVVRGQLDAHAPSPLTGYAVAVAYAWSHVYPDVELAAVLTPAALAKIDVLAHACIPAVVAAYGDRPLSDYVTIEALAAAPWAPLFARNAAGGGKIGAPVLIVQGTADPLVPVAATEVLVRRLCRLGDPVQLSLYPGVGHAAVIAPAMPAMLAWATARLRGATAPSTC